MSYRYDRKAKSWQMQLPYRDGDTMRYGWRNITDASPANQREFESKTLLRPAAPHITSSYNRFNLLRPVYPDLNV